jgi:hypothetical protein
MIGKDGDFTAVRFFKLLTDRALYELTRLLVNSIKDQIKILHYGKRAKRAAKPNATLFRARHVERIRNCSVFYFSAKVLTPKCGDLNRAPGSHCQAQQISKLIQRDLKPRYRSVRPVQERRHLKVGERARVWTAASDRSSLFVPFKCHGPEQCRNFVRHPFKPVVSPRQEETFKPSKVPLISLT